MDMPFGLYYVQFGCICNSSQFSGGSPEAGEVVAWNRKTEDTAYIGASGASGASVLLKIMCAYLGDPPSDTRW